MKIQNNEQTLNKDVIVNSKTHSFLPKNKVACLIGACATGATVVGYNIYKHANNQDCFEKITQEQLPIIKKHETIAKLAQDCSEYDGLGKIDGFKAIKKIEHKSTGFGASVYKNAKTNEIVISYKATKNQLGVGNVLQMLEEKVPTQFKDAERLYKEIKKEFPKQKITVSGHSLGGSLAQLVASKYPDAKAITFDSFGTSSIIEANSKTFKNNLNSINYRMNGSFISYLKKQPGKTKTIKPLLSKGSKHDIENFVNLQNAKFIKNKVKKFNLKKLITDNISKQCKFLLEKIPALKKKIPTLFFKKIK